LNHGGEAWIADKLATWERTFPLYDLLTKQSPEFDEGDMAVYFAAKNLEIKVDKLTHFALGMFWKASVHSWSGARSEPQIELGPYSENLRRWLRANSDFPQHMYLVAVISRPLSAQITLINPYEAIRDGWRTFYMHVPGLVFMLAVGKTVDASLKWLCIHNNPANPIGISESFTGQVQQVMVKTVRAARKTQAYLRSKAKFDQAKRR
jgi:hypothetical protein